MGVRIDDRYILRVDCCVVGGVIRWGELKAIGSMDMTK